MSQANSLRSLKSFMAIAMIMLTMASCSDDGPTGVPTPDGVVYISISANDWTLQEHYVEEDPTIFQPEQTSFSGIFDASSHILRNVGPGDRIIVTFRFRDPLRVTREVNNVGVYVPSSGGLVATPIDPQVSATGDWPVACNPRASLFGDGTHQLTWIAMSTCFAPSVGEELNSVVFELTVPATFNGGAAIIERPELPLGSLQWVVTYDGDHRGEVFPIEPRDDGPSPIGPIR